MTTFWATMLGRTSKRQDFVQFFNFPKFDPDFDADHESDTELFLGRIRNSQILYTVYNIKVVLRISNFSWMRSAKFRKMIRVLNLELCK
jgi:hypothetical protein